MTQPRFDGSATVHNRHAVLLRKAMAGNRDALYQALRVEAPHIDWAQVEPLMEEAESNGRPADGAEPLCSDEASSFGRFLSAPPPARRMLIPDFLPLGVVGLFASPGGVGKSVCLYQLGLSVASGLPYLGMPMEEAGGALLLMAEDKEDELHRRGYRLNEHYDTLGRCDRGTLAQRLHVVSRVGKDNMLTAGREGEVVRTALADRIVATARNIPDCKLIIVDPASRFKGGNANAESDATRFIETLEAISTETGATVISSIHTNKGALRADSEQDQSVVRGSTALVDGSRWVAAMQRLKRSDAADYGVDAVDADRYARLELLKTNYTRPWAGTWLRRETGGVLVPAELTDRSDARRQAQITARSADVLTRLLDLLNSEGPMTRNRIERDYAGTHGPLGAGLQTIRGVIATAVISGELTETDDPAGRGGRLLTPSGAV